jgi:hypothetical protein
LAKPEAAAREKIDQLLTAAGWVVCDAKDANITAHRGVAIREFQLKKGLDASPWSRPTFAFHRPDTLADWIADAQADSSRVAKSNVA